MEPDSSFPEANHQDKSKDKVAIVLDSPVIDEGHYMIQSEDRTSEERGQVSQLIEERGEVSQSEDPKIVIPSQVKVPMPSPEWSRESRRTKMKFGDHGLCQDRCCRDAGSIGQTRGSWTRECLEPSPLEKSALSIAAHFDPATARNPFRNSAIVDRERPGQPLPIPGCGLGCGYIH